MQRYDPDYDDMAPCDEGKYFMAEQALAEIDALHAECDRLTALLQWEQNRRERIGTHGHDCWKWGPSHYECALRKIKQGEHHD